VGCLSATGAERPTPCDAHNHLIDYDPLARHEARMRGEAP